MEQIKHLPNGLTIIDYKNPQVKSVLLYVAFKVGSRNETHKNNGISHLLEHLHFKGTVERPTNNDVSYELDCHGAEHNASTDKEKTDYYIKAPSYKKDLALDVLQDIILNSTFNEKALLVEKQVVSEEINMYNDDPDYNFHNKMEEVMFPESGLEMSIGGTVENVNGFSRQDIISYRDSFYSKENMVICLSGNYDKAYYNNVVKAFASVKDKSPSENRVKFTRPSKILDRLIYIWTAPLKQSSLNWRFYIDETENRAGLNILSSIIGGNSSSILFKKLRNELGLCYSTYSTITNYSDISTFDINIGTDKSKLPKAEEEIGKILKDILANGISKKDFHDAKTAFTGSFSMMADSPNFIVTTLASRYLKRGNFKTVDELINDFQKVSLKDVNKLAQQIFNNPNCLGIMNGQDS